MDLFGALTDKAAGIASQLAAKAKAAARNISELELKVEEATNNDAWGPHGQVMAEIAQAALDVEKFNLIMGVVEQRLLDKDENWRHVYKSLLLIEYMLRHGPLRIVDYLNQNKDALEHLAERFEYRDQNGKDQGINVRQRAKELLAMIADPNRIRSEREKAAKNVGKYTGVSSADFQAYRGSASFMPPQTSERSSNAAGYSTATLCKTKSGDPDDPFEATRKRIQALKMEGAIPDGPITPIKPCPEEDASTRKVKRLSEIAVDPSISAKLGAFPIAAIPAPPGRNAASTTSISTANLLSDFDTFNSAPTTAGMGSAPTLARAPSTAASVQQTASDWNAFEGPTTKPTATAQAASAGDWDAFAGPVGTVAPVAAAAPTSAVEDDWSGFASASATSKSQSKSNANIEAMLNISSAPAPTGGPLPLDAFSSLNTGPQLRARPVAMNPVNPPPFNAFSSVQPAPKAAGQERGPLPLDAFSSFGGPAPIRPIGYPAGFQNPQGFPHTAGFQNPSAGFQNLGVPMGPTPGFAGRPGGPILPHRGTAPLGASAFGDPFADPFSAPIANAPIMQTMPMTFSATTKPATTDKPKVGPEAAAAAKKKDPFSDLLSI